MKKYLFFLLTFLPMVFTACSSDDNEQNQGGIKVLPKIDNISLNYHRSDQTVSLPLDIEKEGAVVSLKDNSSWIERMRLKGDKISFSVSENTETERGCRFDTIVISLKGKRIGTICVTQARTPISPKRLVWALENAMYKNEALINTSMSGLEITKAIYNLEKTTSGKDSYKNYPAFAYCIEMNHDPQNNMEWYLPSLNEINACAKSQSFNGTSFEKHNYWWSATENELRGDAYNVYSRSTASRGSVDKSGDWWVMAFRNGKIEE